MTLSQENRVLLRAVDKARRFPSNTCAASRHVELIGECLAQGKPYPMIDEEPEHVAGSLLSTVASLYEARTEIARLKDLLAPKPVKTRKTKRA